ncbi:MFS transporter [Actinocorallia longicatena]|uniref:MFS transporter n=1 Tax=Actinocorallia longicatena TaxID=111803 RepID=A0ABP6QC47_9ACTN
MQQAPPPEQAGHPRRWPILGVLVVSLLVVVLDNTVLNVAVKTIADPHEGLGATQGQLEWAINSYTLVFAGLLFTFGVLGDRYGRKRTIMLGMVIFGVASLASAYAQTPDQLIWARALMGLGGAALMPQTLSIITNVFPPAERAKAIGIWAGAVGLAVAIGPMTGGLLLDHFWWGSVFLINVPIIIGGLIGMVLLVPESKNPSPGGLDPVGVVLSIVGLVVLSWGIIEGGQKGSWLEPTVLAPIIGGIAVLAAFVWYEGRIDHPAFDVKLFRDPRLSAAVGSITLTFFAASGLFFFSSFYMQSVRGLSPFEAGAMMLPFAAAQLLFSPLSARMVARFGAKRVSSVGLLAVAGALLFWPFFTASTPLWVVGIAFFIQGSGMANVMPPATVSMMQALPQEKAGAGSALSNTARQVAVAMGVAILGSIVSSVYRGDLKEQLATVPEPMRHAAGESLEGTLAAARATGNTGLVQPAYDAFINGMHVAAWISVTVALIGAAAALRFMPGKPANAKTAEPEIREKAGV